MPTPSDVSSVLGILRFWGLKEAKNLQALLGIVVDQEGVVGRWERDRGTRSGSIGDQREEDDEGNKDKPLSRKERRSLEFGTPTGVGRREKKDDDDDDNPSRSREGTVKKEEKQARGLSSQEMIELALKNRVGSSANLAGMTFTAPTQSHQFDKSFLTLYTIRYIQRKRWRRRKGVIRGACKWYQRSASEGCRRGVHPHTSKDNGRVFAYGR